MLFFFLSIIFVLSYWYLTTSGKESDFTPSLKYILIVMSLIFFCADFYTYAILGTEISRFYAGGIGTTYINSNMTNTTIFNTTDLRIGYYIGETSYDYLFIEQIKMVAGFALFVLALIGAYDYVTRHNLLGQDVGKGYAEEKGEERRQ